MIFSLRLVLHLPFETTRGAITKNKKRKKKKLLIKHYYCQIRKANSVERQGRRLLRRPRAVNALIPARQNIDGT